MAHLALQFLQLLVACLVQLASNAFVAFVVPLACNALLAPMVQQVIGAQYVLLVYAI